MVCFTTKIREKVKSFCRCGQTKQEVICSEIYDKETNVPKEILCDVICKKKRNCGRHTCNTVCCPVAQIKANAHPCPITCGRLLACKNHKCTEPCHKGKCKPCLNASFDELCCTCGKTIIYPPVACGTKPPECPHPCNRFHDCDHPVLHPCHYDEECPKCYSLVTRQCGCGKKLMTTKCYIESPCCGNLCKKPLKCGKHVCQKPCHGGLCESESIAPGESCGTRCNAEILTCSHKCSAPCHPGKNCPSIQCQEEVTLRCPCGNNTASGICLHGDDNNNQFNNDRYIRLECNDVCALKIRQKQLASAFGRAEDLSDVIPTYPITLTNAAHSVPKFVTRIEKTFRSLIDSPSKTFQFPPMNSFYRSIIHQLAEFYKLDSISYDQEPNRNVCVTKTYHSSVPFVTLSDLVKRQPIPKQPGTGDGINKVGKPSALLFYNLTPTVRSDHIHIALRPFYGEYFLKWIDDTSAVATFNDEDTMKKAASSISHISDFGTCPLLESDYAAIFTPKILEHNQSDTIQKDESEDLVNEQPLQPVDSEEKREVPENWSDIEDSLEENAEII